MEKTYYKLLIDSYGQPSGEILEIQLTEEEYERRREREFLYESYTAALWRAQD